MQYFEQPSILSKNVKHDDWLGFNLRSYKEREKGRGDGRMKKGKEFACKYTHIKRRGRWLKNPPDLREHITM